MLKNIQEKFTFINIKYSDTKSVYVQEYIDYIITTNKILPYLKKIIIIILNLDPNFHKYNPNLIKELNESFDNIKNIKVFDSNNPYIPIINFYFNILNTKDFNFDKIDYEKLKTHFNQYNNLVGLLRSCINEIKARDKTIRTILKDIKI